MTRAAAGALLLLALAACHTPFSNPDPVEIVDLATPVDIAQGPFCDVCKSGCSGFVVCYIDCLNSDPAATDDKCTTMCGKTSRAEAPLLFSAALRCGQQHCVAAGACLRDGDGFLNPDGSPITATRGPPNYCGVCLNDSLSKLFGDPCVDPASPSCNPPECRRPVTACTASRP
jgi:hypothetical protein